MCRSLQQELFLGRKSKVDQADICSQTGCREIPEHLLLGGSTTTHAATLLESETRLPGPQAASRPPYPCKEVSCSPPHLDDGHDPPDSSLLSAAHLPHDGHHFPYPSSAGIASRTLRCRQEQAPVPATWPPHCSPQGSDPLEPGSCISFLPEALLSPVAPSLSTKLPFTPNCSV